MNKVEIHASILMKERGRETKRHTERERENMRTFFCRRQNTMCRRNDGFQ